MKTTDTPAPRRIKAGAIRTLRSQGFNVTAWNGEHWLILAHDVDEAEAKQVVRWYNRRPMAANPRLAGAWLDDAPDGQA